MTGTRRRPSPQPGSAGSATARGGTPESGPGAREVVLQRIRAANRAAGSTPAERPEAPPVVRPGDVDLFCENVGDYRATVVRTTRDALADAVAAAVTDLNLGSLVVPEGLDPSWLDGLPDRVRRQTAGAASGIGAGELDRIDGVVTSATVGIARTGTIILDHGPGQGARALTLVPDTHVCVVAADQVVADVPDALARLTELGSATRPLTWISGPSATSDIELSRVEGVHGPRRLLVVLWS